MSQVAVMCNGHAVLIGPTAKFQSRLKSGGDTDLAGLARLVGALHGRPSVSRITAVFGMTDKPNPSHSAQQRVVHNKFGRQYSNFGKNTLSRIKIPRFSTSSRPTPRSRSGPWPG